MNFYNCFQLNSFSSTNQWILGKIWKFVIFIISCLNQQKSEVWMWNDCTNSGAALCKILNPLVKNWRSYGRSFVAMATATLFLFLDVVFEGNEERIWIIYYSGSLVDSFCPLCLVFREIKRKALIGNDDVIVFDVIKLLTSQHGNVTSLRYVVLKTVL